MNLFQRISQFLNRSKNEKDTSIIQEASITNIEKLPEFELSEFVGNLRQVISWTEKLSQDFHPTRNSYATVFRQTNPEINKVKLYNLDLDYPRWNYEDEESTYLQLLDLAIQA